MKYLLSDDGLKKYCEGKDCLSPQCKPFHVDSCTAQAQLSHALPLIRQDVAREIFEWMDDNLHLLHILYAGEVAKYQALKTKYGVEDKDAEFMALANEANIESCEEEQAERERDTK